MNYRNKSNYPPYSHIIEILIFDDNVDRLNKSLKYVQSEVEKIDCKKYKPYELLKIKKQHRYRILLFSQDLINTLNQIHSIVDKYVQQKNMSYIKVDIDPLYLE